MNNIFTPTTLHKLESKMINAFINDYWNYLLEELDKQNTITKNEIEYLKKSGVLNNFLTENQCLIDCYRLGLLNTNNTNN